jgi:DNA polymerase-4
MHDKNSNREVGHLNVVGFRAAVAGLTDSSLRGRAYAIAGRVGGQAVAWDVSAAAINEGIKPGMPLAAAQRLVKDLIIIENDRNACFKANEVLEKVISRYAPVWQNDGAGNIYLDITGTRRLFGPTAACICHIQNEILNHINIEAAAAAGTNKLVCKVASRTIEVRAGEEACFLAHQDITLLPGIGPSIMKTIRITGFRETGELAALTDSEALSLFGKKGVFLRDSALGIDNSPVAAAANRVIESRCDFPEDVIEDTIIHGAIACIAGHAGLEMRRDKLGTTVIKMKVVYSDGEDAEGREKSGRPLVLDRDITTAAQRLYRKTVHRRIRVRSAALSLEELVPLAYEPELFEPETETRLQEAADRIQERYGAGTISRAINPKLKRIRRKIQ